MGTRVLLEELELEFETCSVRAWSLSEDDGDTRSFFMTYEEARAAGLGLCARTGAYLQVLRG